MRMYEMKRKLQRLKNLEDLIENRSDTRDRPNPNWRVRNPHKIINLSPEENDEYFNKLRLKKQLLNEASREKYLDAIEDSHNKRKYYRKGVDFGSYDPDITDKQLDEVLKIILEKRSGRRDLDYNRALLMRKKKVKKSKVKRKPVKKCRCK